MAIKKERRSGWTSRTIADEMRDLIIRGTLSPGLQLRQVELAGRFDSSRVPVREALKLLTAEGVVTHDPNRGFFVATLSRDEAEQLYRIRHLLEQEMLASVQWPDKKQLKHMEKLLDSAEEQLKKGERQEWSLRHREFYRALLDLSPRQVLVREVERVLRLTERYRSFAPLPVGPARSMAAERHVLKAMAQKDRQKLLQAFDEDRSEVERQMLAALTARGL